MIICITGKSGCGKSFISKKLAEELDYRYLDVDNLAKQIYLDKSILKFTFSSFPELNNKLDTKVLGSIIFSEKSDRVTKFNNLTFKYIVELIDKEIKKAKDNIILDWVQLPNTKFWNESIKILVKAPHKLRIRTISKRDNITESYINLRDSFAPNFDNLTLDFVIVNNYNEEEIDSAISDIIKKLTEE